MAKPEPFRVTVTAALVAGAEVGLMLVRVGGCGLTVNENAVEVEPPEFTVIEALLAPPMDADGTDAVNCVALTNFVTSGVKFHSTVVPAKKFVPFTVSVNVAP
jgi:hypothetical protein